MSWYGCQIVEIACPGSSLRVGGTAKSEAKRRANELGQIATHASAMCHEISGMIDTSDEVEKSKYSCIYNRSAS